MKRKAIAPFALALLSILPLSPVFAAGLGGSMSSMRRQYAIAKQNDFTFLRTASQVQEFVRKNRLEPVRSGPYLLVNNVSFPYARPAVKVFVERLAEQYHAATGQRLVVTSLTRPLSRQPRNAHELSVHPTGMAIDLRVPRDARARKWLESTLLQLERQGLLDATRERRPPHYHVAVYPRRYQEYVEDIIGKPAFELAAHEIESAEPIVVTAPSLEPADAHPGVHVEDAGEVAVHTASMTPLPFLGGMALTGVLAGLVGLTTAARRRRRRRAPTRQ